MALIAKHVHIRHIQHSWVLRAMRAMTAKASNAFHRGMLKDKRTTHVRVTLGANPVLVRRSSQIVRAKGAVCVMAVGAFNRPLCNRMMKGHGKLCLYVRMATFTKLRLLRQQ
jgi:hypothetical protein